MIGCKFSGSHQLRRRQHLRLRHCPAGGKGRFLKLSNVHMFAAAIRIPRCRRHRDFLLFRIRIAANRRAAVRAATKPLRSRTKLRLSIPALPTCRRQIHLARRNMHAYLRTPDRARPNFLPPSPACRPSPCTGAVGKRDARHTFRSGLHQVAFIQGQLVVGARPLHRIYFLHLYLPVEIDKPRLPRADRRHAIVLRPNRL